MIRRHSMDPEDWRSTSIGALRPEVLCHLALLPGELVLVCAFFSDTSWYAFTTRRIVSKHAGTIATLDPKRGVESQFGNFKGYGPGSNTELGAIPTATATLKCGASTLQLEYETGKPSMAPIYAAKYWSQKHPILDKLLTNAERALYKSRNV
ncbi:hypothetical protein EV701_109104 [Chthoniobacter flavus]|nr:hypothetical protein EV701_109104 [Chthoniobacter flavus]